MLAEKEYKLLAVVNQQITTSMEITLNTTNYKNYRKIVFIFSNSDRGVIKQYEIDSYLSSNVVLDFPYNSNQFIYGVLQNNNVFLVIGAINDGVFIKEIYGTNKWSVIYEPWLSTKYVIEPNTSTPLDTICTAPALVMAIAP